MTPFKIASKTYFLFQEYRLLKQHTRQLVVWMYLMYRSLFLSVTAMAGRTTTKYSDLELTFSSMV